MAPNKYRPNYQELYPDVEISSEVMSVLLKSDRKMKYMEIDLKVEQPIESEGEVNPRAIPAREDSFDRLLEVNKEFDSGESSPLQQLMKNQLSSVLHASLAQLDAEEMQIVNYVYFEDKTMREAGKELGISHVAVQKRPKKLLAKLKKLMLT